MRVGKRENRDTPMRRRERKETQEKESQNGGALFRAHVSFIPARARLIVQIRCPGHPSGASVYPQGAKCHVRCRGGFRLEGAHTRHCVTGGRWNGQEPICLREVATDSLYNPGNVVFSRSNERTYVLMSGDRVTRAGARETEGKCPRAGVRFAFLNGCRRRKRSIDVLVRRKFVKRRAAERQEGARRFYAITIARHERRILIARIFDVTIVNVNDDDDEETRSYAPGKKKKTKCSRTEVEKNDNYTSFVSFELIYIVESIILQIIAIRAAIASSTLVAISKNKKKRQSIRRN